MSDNIIIIENLIKQYGKGSKSKEVIKGLNMQLVRGDIFGLVGRNGAGKTTLLKCIAGIVLPNGGSIELFGESNPKKLHISRAKIGGIIEKPPIDEDLSAWDNLKIYAIRMGISDERIREVLETVDLTCHGNAVLKRAPVKTFSLGMKQRLGIAIALLGKPELMILDEPLNGLDPEGIMWFRELVLDLNKQGVSFIISSHLLRELNEVATCYGIMKSGQIIGNITADKLHKSGENFEEYYKRIVGIG
ncbi:MAG: ATP-binding cassette domain-containing protein [Lachnospiraceae bacterium]|nr:ATP-binding cassette domain-containing protein [Lachnospiraceae bacterium]